MRAHDKRESRIQRKIEHGLYAEGRSTYASRAGGDLIPPSAVFEPVLLPCVDRNDLSRRFRGTEGARVGVHVEAVQIYSRKRRGTVHSPNTVSWVVFRVVRVVTACLWIVMCALATIFVSQESS